MIDFDVISGRDIILDDNGRVTVYPDEFVANVSDYDDLTFWFYIGGDRTSLTFTCNDIGSHTVFIVATDKNGNRSQPKEVTFTVSDRTPPVFDVISQSVALNREGNIIVYPKDFVTNASDNCSNEDNITFVFVIGGADQASLTLTCNDIGSHTVSIAAIDGNSNRSLPKEVTFSISDETPPIARCNPITLYFNADGMATLTAMMIDNGSTDNCGIVSRQIKRTSDSDELYANSLDFDRDELDVLVNGRVSVTFRVIDASGNEAICITEIRLAEQISPPNLDIPSIFTPNGDGFNDTWDIPGIDRYPEATIRIYNRAKRLIVEFKGSQMPWDGRDDKGNLLESGYYLYQIELRNERILMSGYVTILR